MMSLSLKKLAVAELGLGYGCRHRYVPAKASSLNGGVELVLSG